jgi:hypothetical protein
MSKSAVDRYGGTITSAFSNQMRRQEEGNNQQQQQQKIQLNLYSRAYDGKYITGRYPVYPGTYVS